MVLGSSSGCTGLMKMKYYPLCFDSDLIVDICLLRSIAILLIIVFNFIPFPLLGIRIPLALNLCFGILFVEIMSQLYKLDGL